MPIDVSNQGLCAICRRIDKGLAVLRSGRLLWVCDDPECLEIADRAGTMKQDEFTRLEAEAAIQGCGNAMGQFLDEAGYGHLFADVPADVWAQAQKVGIAGYRRELKRLVDSNAAPF
jgi:hypothetical protein